MPLLTETVVHTKNAARLNHVFRFRLPLGKSGDVKGTIGSDVKYLMVSRDVRRHRLISISYISLLPFHGSIAKVLLLSTAAISYFIAASQDSVCRTPRTVFHGSVQPTRKPPKLLASGNYQ